MDNADGAAGAVPMFVVQGKSGRIATGTTVTQEGTIMSSTFKVDTARIAAASGDIQRIAGSIESEVRAMMTKLNGLQDCWQGSAAANFAAVSNDWNATQERVRASLQNISVALRTAGDQYAQVEADNRMRFTAE